MKAVSDRNFSHHELILPPSHVWNFQHPIDFSTQKRVDIYTNDIVMLHSQTTVNDKISINDFGL